MKSIRNNDRLIYEDADLAGRFWKKLEAHCPATLDSGRAIALGLNERFRFYRYGPGHQFKRHIDGRFKRSKLEESRITFMIYLNEGFEGGATAFDDVTIAPKPGLALCFLHEQKHEGCPVLAGTKYVLRSDVMFHKV